MTANDYYSKWNNINWRDDREHFAERAFIELLAERDSALLAQLEPQVLIRYDNKNGRIDFVLSGKYPIEIDGESYHSEARVTPENFDSLTIKQNKIVQKYGNITRITYKMIRDRPSGVVNLINGNLESFNEQERKFQAELAKIHDAETRKQAERQELLRRQAEYGRQLRQEYDELLADIDRAKQTLDNYQTWWGKHQKLIIGLFVIAIIVAIGIVAAVINYNQHQQQLQAEQAAAEHAEQIKAGNLCMTPAEVKEYVGQNGVCVKYYVNYVNSTKYGYIWLSDKKGSDFAAFVQDEGVMTTNEAYAYRNKTVEVHGDLTEYSKGDKTTYQVVVKSKNQIKIVDY